MENKTRSRVMLAITLFSAIVLSGTVFVCAKRAGEEVTQRSFDELTTATKQLAKDINNATRTDQTILSAMAERMVWSVRVALLMSLASCFVAVVSSSKERCVTSSPARFAQTKTVPDNTIALNSVIASMTRERVLFSISFSLLLCQLAQIALRLPLRQDA